eukprot:768110-Hanusia_phi.AAC.1
MRQLLKRQDSGDLSQAHARRRADEAKGDEEKRLVERQLREAKAQVQSLQGDLLLAVEEGIKYRESLRRLVELQQAKGRNEQEAKSLLEAKSCETKKLLTKLVELREELSSLTRDRDALREQLQLQGQVMAGVGELIRQQGEDARQSLEALDEVLKSLESDMQDMMHAQQRTHVVASQVAASCSSMVSELRMATRDCIGLSAQLEAAGEATRRAEQNRTELDRRQQQLDANRALLRSLEQQTLSLCKQVAASEADLRLFQEEAQRQWEMRREEREEMARVRSSCSEKSRTVSQLQQELDELKKSSVETIANMQLKQEKLRAENEALSAREQEEGKRKRELLLLREDKIATLTSEREKLEDELRRKTDELEDARRKLKEREEETRRLREEKNEVMRRLRDLEEGGEERRGREDELEKLLEIARCKSEVSAKLERELEEEMHKKEELATALRQAQEETSHVRLQRLRDEEEAKRERQKLEREKEMLTTAREDWTRREERWRRELDMLLRSNEELRVQVESLSSQAARKEREEREREEKEREKEKDSERGKRRDENSEDSSTILLQTPLRAKLARIDDQVSL